MKSYKEFLTETERSIASLTDKEAKEIRVISSALSQFKTQYALNRPQFFDSSKGKVVLYPALNRVNADGVRVNSKTINNISKIRGIQWIEFGTDAIKVGY